MNIKNLFKRKPKQNKSYEKENMKMSSIVEEYHDKCIERCKLIHWYKNTYHDLYTHHNKHPRHCYFKSYEFSCSDFIISIDRTTITYKMKNPVNNTSLNSNNILKICKNQSGNMYIEWLPHGLRDADKCYILETFNIKLNDVLKEFENATNECLALETQATIDNLPKMH